MGESMVKYIRKIVEKISNSKIGKFSQKHNKVYSNLILILILFYF
jgi:hypothetical protein